MHPVTNKQKQYIQEMKEFSKYPLPAFVGTTKEEAAMKETRWSNASRFKLLL